MSTILKVTGTLRHASHGKPLICSLGDCAQLSRRFTKEDVQAFAVLTNDFNSIHFQASQKFEKPIVHGLLYTSLIPTLFSTAVPGTLYRSQTFEFRNPVFHDELITAHIEIVKVSLIIHDKYTM